MFLEFLLGKRHEKKRFTYILWVNSPKNGVDSNNAKNKRILTYILIHSVLLKLKTSFSAHRPLTPPVSPRTGELQNSQQKYRMELPQTQLFIICQNYTFICLGTCVQDDT